MGFRASRLSQFSPGGDLGGSAGSQIVQRATGIGGVFAIDPTKTKTGNGSKLEDENDGVYQRYSGAQTVTVATFSITDLTQENIFVSVMFGTSTMSSSCFGTLGPALYRRSGGNTQTELAATWSLTGGGLAGCSATMTASGTTVVVAVTVPSGTTDVWVEWSRLKRSVSTTPSISGVSPSHGPSSATTSITISGANLSTTTGVTIGGVACTSVVASSGSVTCVTPTGTVGSQALVLTASAGTASSTFTYDDALAPTLTSITPNHGAAGGGTVLALGGTNLTGHTSITINGNACTSVVEDSGILNHVTTPVGSGAQTLTYTTAHGSATIAFTYDASTFDAQAAFGSSHVLRWGRADDSYTHAGSPARVSQLTDKTSNAADWHETASTNDGLWNAADVNGLASLTFAPTGGSAGGPVFYGNDGTVKVNNLYGATAATWTQVFVGRVHLAHNNDAVNASGGDGLLVESTGLYSLITVHNRGGTGNASIVYAVFTTAYHNCPDVVVPLDTWFVLTVRYDGTSYYVGIRLPGVAFTETAPTTAAAIPSGGRTGPTVVGKGVGTTRYFDGKIAEDVSTDNDLGFTALKNNVVDPLAAFYGIT